MSKFSKMIKSGLISGKKSPKLDTNISEKTETKSTPHTKFNSVKRKLAKDSNLMKKYKI
jgi:hypothetical protein